MLQEFHLSDQELLLAADGELTPGRDEQVRAHLAACWTCRVRQREIEAAIGEFIHFHRDIYDPQIPPPEGPRALLRARLAQISADQAVHRFRLLRGISQRLSWAAVALTVAASAITYVAVRSVLTRYPKHPIAVTVPNPALTPGATVLFSRQEVCSQTSVNNKFVPVALRNRVFDEYGIRGAEPGAYEVDYLITPALGGADDIRNLWPESNRTTLWNAQVKDALEDRLRDLVCGSQLDLATAQREIAGNWIEAYKKYFHTNQPVTGPR